MNVNFFKVFVFLIWVFKVNFRFVNDIFFRFFVKLIIFVRIICLFFFGMKFKFDLVMFRILLCVLLKIMIVFELFVVVIVFWIVL